MDDTTMTNDNVWSRVPANAIYDQSTLRAAIRLVEEDELVNDIVVLALRMVTEYQFACHGDPIHGFHAAATAFAIRFADWMRGLPSGDDAANVADITDLMHASHLASTMSILEDLLWGPPAEENRDVILANARRALDDAQAALDFANDEQE